MSTEAGYKQVSDFPSTGAVANSDIFYSQNVNTGIEQKTTALQLQAYVQAPIAGSTLTDAGTLEGNESFPVGRGSLLQTTLTKIATFVMSPLSAGTSTAAGTLTGTEIIPATRTAGLLQTTLTNVASWLTTIYTGSLRVATGGVARTLDSRFQEEWRITDFGVANDGSVDALAGFSAAVNAIQAIVAAQNSPYPVPVIVVPAGTYKFSNTLNTYPWVKFKTLGSVTFDFSGIPVSANGIVCRNQQTTIPAGPGNWGTHSPFLDGSGGTLFILGPGKSVSTGSAIVVGNTSTSSNPVRDTGAVNVVVEQFGNVIEIDPINCYLLKFKGCRFEQNGNAGIICNPSSGSQINSGERILFEDCTFSGMPYVLYQNCDGFSYDFMSCSFDYNGTPFFYGPNGRYGTVRLIGGHTEAFDGKFFDATTSGQYVNLVIKGHDILPTFWQTTGTAAANNPSRTLIDGNSASHMRLDVDGLTLEFTARPGTPNSSLVGSNVDIYAADGIIYQAFYAPFSTLRSLGRDYDFITNPVGTLATALTEWEVLSSTSVTTADIQAAPGLTGSQALHLTGADPVAATTTIGTTALFPCSPGEALYPGCDYYGGTATGALNVRVFLRYYDATGNQLSDSNTWFTYSMATAYADTALSTAGSTAQWYSTNYVVALAPAKAAMFRICVTASAFQGDVYLRNVRACYTSNRSAASTIPALNAVLGNIPYVNGLGALATDPANLFYDSVNKRLGVGTKSPQAPMHGLVVSNGAATTVARYENYSSTAGGGVYTDYNAYNAFGAVGVRQYVYSPTGTALHRYRIYVNGGSGLTTVAEFSDDNSLPGMVVGGVGPATSTLQSAGTFALPIPVYKLNVTYPAGNADFCILGDGTAIAQLPSPATCPGRLYAVKNYGTGNTTIKRNLTTDTIDGITADIVMNSRYTTYLLQSNGTAGWYIIAMYSSPIQAAVSASIGGAALAAGAATSATVAMAGATVGMVVQVTPSTYPGDGFVWSGYVSAAGVVTIKVTAIVAGTPTASVYNVRVIP